MFPTDSLVTLEKACIWWLQVYYKMLKFTTYIPSNYIKISHYFEYNYMLYLLKCSHYHYFVFPLYQTFSFMINAMTPSLIDHFEISQKVPPSHHHLYLRRITFPVTFTGASSRSQVWLVYPKSGAYILLALGTIL